MDDGKLTIRNIAKADSGDYACSAKNFLGQDFVVAQLIVIDRLTFTLTPELLFLKSKMPTFVTETSFQFKE